MALGSDRIVVSHDARVQEQFDAGLRAHMLRVYNYMASGLALTGIVAYFLASSGLYVQMAHSGLIWLFILAPFGFILFMNFKIESMRSSTAQAIFWLFAASMGVSLASIFLVYTNASIARVFFITAATFAGMSLYGYTTQKDLSGWGSFLMMGLIGIIIASLVNIFVGSSALQFAVSVIGVIIFVGLTAFDTQRIKLEYSEHYGQEAASKLAILGALRLYLDFINLFIMLMQLLGDRR